MPILCTKLIQAIPPVSRAIGGEVSLVDELTSVEHLLASDPLETLVVVGPDVDLDEALAFTAAQRLARPALGVVLLRDAFEVKVLALAIRAGVREVVPVSDLDLIAEACTRSLELSKATPAGLNLPIQQGVEGKVAVVFATKGGCGKTTTATNLAVALHAGGASRVCLVDLDLAFGDVAISLQLTPARTLVDALAMDGGLDETGVSGLLTRYRPGLDCVLAPVEPGDSEQIPASLITDLILVLRRMFDYVVVDTPPQFNEHVLAVLDEADHHVLLTTPDVPTLKNLRLTLDMLDMLSYPRDRRSIVLNREDPRVGLTVADVESVARTNVTARIPASLAVPASINRGVPITIESPDHAVSVAIKEIATRTIVGAKHEPPASKRGFLGLRRRSG
ncbi:transcriptional regulator [Lentzea sp. NBRC 105346]|uniref:AAA family ATPase n=1 Tax=Lentzea sp. NBRC 105346 TaxID=3032205 RepID=UPI0024A30696|nr:P-loop NTPase [Lentzea sp. NBRC 105346]GLZ30133.1 transcriptional regulator [Lentzea sp. NBRC 105346]